MIGFTSRLILFLCLSVIGSGISASAEVLQGGVSKDEAIRRLQRPSSDDGGMGALPGAAQQSMRIPRPGSGGSPMRGLVDTAAFAPLSGRTQQSAMGSGVVQSGAFEAPPVKNFDLGADRQSRELVLAWERWHRQLSGAIYQRWSARANAAGHATVKVTVSRERIITAEISDSNGSPRFIAGLMDSIVGLNGNPGLTFPSKSERQKVSFEADYVAGRDVTPGFNWVHGDVERVRD